MACQLESPMKGPCRPDARSKPCPNKRLQLLGPPAASAGLLGCGTRRPTSEHPDGRDALAVSDPMRQRHCGIGCCEMIRLRRRFATAPVSLASLLVLIVAADEDEWAGAESAPAALRRRRRHPRIQPRSEVGAIRGRHAAASFRDEPATRQPRATTHAVRRRRGRRSPQHRRGDRLGSRAAEMHQALEELLRVSHAAERRHRAPARDRQQRGDRRKRRQQSLARRRGRGARGDHRAPEARRNLRRRRRHDRHADRASVGRHDRDARISHRFRRARRARPRRGSPPRATRGRPFSDRRRHDAPRRRRPRRAAYAERDGALSRNGSRKSRRLRRRRVRGRRDARDRPWPARAAGRRMARRPARVLFAGQPAHLRAVQHARTDESRRRRVRDDRLGRPRVGRRAAADDAGVARSARARSDAPRVGADRLTQRAGFSA